MDSSARKTLTDELNLSYSLVIHFTHSRFEHQRTGALIDLLIQIHQGFESIASSLSTVKLHFIHYSRYCINSLLSDSVEA